MILLLLFRNSVALPYVEDFGPILERLIEMTVLGIVLFRFAFLKIVALFSHMANRYYKQLLTIEMIKLRMYVKHWILSIKFI